MIVLEGKRSAATQEVSTQTEHLLADDIDKTVESDNATLCILDSTEINIIRKAYRSTSDVNAGLRGRLEVLENDVIKLTAENRKQLKLVQSLTTQLNKAVTANRRLEMLAEHLTSELEHSSREVDHLRLEQEDKDLLISNVQRLEAKLAATVRYEKIQKSSQKAKCLALLEKQRLDDAARQIELQNELSKMIDKLNEATCQLDKEKSDHARTCAALEHLRLHFASRHTEHNLTQLTYH